MPGKRSWRCSLRRPLPFAVPASGLRPSLRPIVSRLGGGEGRQRPATWDGRRNVVNDGHPHLAWDQWATSLAR